jgi:hypothetical protein
MVGRTLYCGEERLAEAAAAATGRKLRSSPPLRRLG